MSASSYDNDEKEQWDSIDKYSMSVIYTASIDIKSVEWVYEAMLGLDDNLKEVLV